MKVVREVTPIGKQLTVILKNLEGKVGKVGWFEKSKYDDAKSTPVAYVATIHEYGYPAGNIPPRPFMRPTIKAKRGEWATTAEKGSKRILQGKATIELVMEAIGQQAQGDISYTISKLVEPPLKPATIQARINRRSDKVTVGLLTKPLIDTGIMFNTLTNTVEDA